jgi:hypothetical protein
MSDLFDWRLADPDPWKRNSFARLRDRLILSLKKEITRTEFDQLREQRRYGKKRFNQIRSDARYTRAKELLALIQPKGAP